MSGQAGGANVLANLRQKMTSLRDELDQTKESYDQKCRELEGEKSRREDAENEVHSLRRRIQLLEDSNEQLEGRLATTNEKLQQVAIIADENDRSRRNLESRQNVGDDRIAQLEERLRQANAVAAEFERNYEEVTRRLVVTESELRRSEERAEAAESKARTLDNDLHFISNNLKSIELSEHTLADREDGYKATIAELNRRLTEAEHVVEVLSRELKTKQHDLDRVEDALQESKLQYKALREEMDNYLHDLSDL